MHEYLAMRRGLGFKLHEAGLRLEDFVSFMEQRRARRITSSLALTWAQKSRAAQPVIRAQRLQAIHRAGEACGALEHRPDTGRRLQVP
jgi:integrase/recombinase XerD